jgi:hypothetical protein
MKEDGGPGKAGREEEVECRRSFQILLSAPKTLVGHYAKIVIEITQKE